MAPRFLLFFFMTFATVAFTAAAGNIAAMANATAADNTTASITDTKARFICTYEGGSMVDGTSTRLVLIDKKIDSFLTLQAQIASFFPKEKAKFAIRYKLLNRSDHAKRINVITDDDARNLMALYEALTRDSSNPVPIALYVKPPLQMGWYFWLAVGCLLAVNRLSNCLHLWKEKQYMREN